MKTFNQVRVFAIFLLILIPFVYLFFYFEKLYEKKETENSELIKEQLLNEMDKYQDDLKPEKYIEKAFKDLEKQLNFPDLESSQYKFTASNDYEPDFINKEYINKARYFLKENYGIQTLLFLSSSYDLTNINLDKQKDFFLDKNNETKYKYSCIGTIIQKTLYEKTFLTPILLKNINKFNSTFNLITHECSIGRKNPDYIHTFELQTQKNISIFYKNIGKPKSCSAFFGNEFGNQLIYQYYNSLIQKEKDDKSHILGLYYALIKTSDISINKLFVKAYNDNNLKNKNTLIKRGVMDKFIKAPDFDDKDPNKISYAIPFPSHFYNFIQNHSLFNKEEYNRYLDYLQNHSLIVSIDRNSLKNDYSFYKKLTLFIILFIVILSTLYILNNLFNIVELNFSLSLKVRLVVLVAVSVPMIGLWIITSIGLKNEEKIYLNKIEKSIFDRMALFDKLRDDVINKFTFDLVDQKKFLADLYTSYPKKWLDYYKRKYNPLKFSQLKTLDYLGNFEYIIDGISKPIKFKEISVLFRIMQDMHLLDLKTKANADNQKQDIIVSAFVDALLKIYNSQNILAKESHLIPTELRLTNKVSYQLITTKNNPKTPKLLVYNFMNINSVMKKELMEQLTQHYTELLSQELGLTQVKYAVFERSESDYKESVKQARIFPFRQLQLDAAKKAIIKNSSGSEIEEDKENYYLKIWRYFNDNPILLVAAAIVPKSQLTIITGKTIALVLIIYGLFVVALLSDFFSNALLEPIKTLTKFVKEIGLGHFNIKVNMKTGDEMEELGDSFNRMSEGLCEREKLKRFVSDKLFSSIANSSENKISKAKVTILSSDIRSFTTISEKNSPEAVVTLLNDYFTLMEKSITKYGGSIEKIVGDAISAAFYEEKNSDYSINACKAALEMRESLKNFNKERISKGLFSIENGIGLASGEVMIGFAGEKARRREFLLIGDILKTAEKLESMTKTAISSKVYIDKQTYECIKGKIEVCPEQTTNEIFYRELQS